MKTAVIIFPGSNCDRDLAIALERTTSSAPTMIWHKDNHIPDDVEFIGLPGGFSYGDYLRCGAMAAHSPIMAEIKRHAGRGTKMLGICNGFQILLEAGLLPGALLRNAGLKFVHGDTHITANDNAVYRMPIAHHDGNYFIDQDGLKDLQDNGQIAFTYQNNPNGSIADIAGITVNNITGMMPHPERATDETLSAGNDGATLLKGLLNA